MYNKKCYIHFVHSLYPLEYLYLLYLFFIVRNKIYFVGKEINFVTNFFSHKLSTIFHKRNKFCHIWNNCFDKRKIFCREWIFCIKSETNFVLREIFLFFTNETDLAIHTLIKYKHIIPAYVPCIWIYCAISVITVKIAMIIMLN